MQVVIGRIAKAHGVTGEMAVEIRTDSPEQRFKPGATLNATLRNGDKRELTVVAVRYHGERLLLRCEHITDRDTADVLRGTVLYGDTADLLPIDDPDEFYDHQLEGLNAELGDGTFVGTVQEVIHIPGGELLSITRDGQTVLVPFVQDIVPTVDIVGKRLVLDPPEGLLDS